MPNMAFENVRNALVSILGAAAAGRFETVGYQRQGVAASTQRGTNRSVAVYYQRGNFPKHKGAIIGETHHDATFTIELAVSASAKGSANTPGSVTMAEYHADQDLDALINIVYQILMDQGNYDVGLAVGTVADRWVDDIQKDGISQRGELPYLTGRMTYTIAMRETVVGTTYPADATAYKVTIDLDGDAVEKTAVSGTLGGT